MGKDFRLKRSDGLLLDAVGNVLSKREYEDIYDRAQRYAYRFTSITLILSTVLFLFILLPIAFGIFDQQNLAGWQAFLIFIMLVLPLTLVSYVIRRKEDRIKRKFFSKYMVARGLRPDKCLMCGYDLRGSTATQCPECGEPLAPNP